MSAQIVKLSDLKNRDPSSALELVPLEEKVPRLRHDQIPLEVRPKVEIRLRVCPVERTEPFKVDVGRPRLFAVLGELQNALEKALEIHALS